MTNEHDGPDALFARTPAQAGLIALLESCNVFLPNGEHLRDVLTDAYKRLMEGREEERLHLAQELHDGPLQDLYGILYGLDNLSHQTCDQQSRVALLALCEMTQVVIRALRTICGELRPPALVPFGLEVAIRSHVQTLRESHPELDIQLDLMHDGITLTENVRLALFRIYQQAINNIVQHAAARSVVIRLTIQAEQVVLEIQDDGCGFNVQECLMSLVYQGHFGLLGIAERAAALGGRADIISVVDGGTTIRAIVPRTTCAGAKEDDNRF